MRHQHKLAELKARCATERFAFVFFWGHTPYGKATVGPFCLSNWYPSPFELRGQRYPTAEHYIMAEKARLFGDADTRARVLAAADPGAAKALGRKVRSFDEDTWIASRFEIGVAGIEAKFRQNEALGEYLVGTGERVLVEASPKDRIWGIGLARDDPRASDPLRWRGLNLLGFALMEVRHLLLTA